MVGRWRSVETRTPSRTEGMLRPAPRALVICFASNRFNVHISPYSHQSCHCSHGFGGGIAFDCLRILETLKIPVPSEVDSGKEWPVLIFYRGAELRCM